MNTNRSNNKNKVIEDCLVELANGNIDAMDILYETIKKDIYAFALSKVQNKFDADDILQDTFIRIYENAKLYTPQGKPMAWIFTIETNIINRYYQIKNRTELFDDDTTINSIPDENNTNEEKTIQNEYVQTILNNLNDFEREVILLHIVSDMKFKDIATQLDKPLSTVLSKYNRAIKKLKKIVKEES